MRQPSQVLRYVFLSQVLLLLACTFSFAQQNPRSTGAGRLAVTGTVLDDKGAPLAGVSVSVKNAPGGVSTDKTGYFSISVPESNPVLLFTYVGYETVERVVRENAAVNISLLPSKKGLDEVVVVGYGTQSKRAVSGSVVSVGFDKFKDRSFSNVTQSLAGSVPGVNISQAQGAPGQLPIIRVRGISSITAGTNPLIVVDGVPLENFNLNLINPQDIESVDILKDASSAAIYGSRGSSGVILVTTKIGKSGRSTISAGYEHGVSKVVRKVKMMDAQQWIQYYMDAKNNAWVDLGNGHSASDPNSARTSLYQIPVDFTNNPGQFGKGTDWQDVMFRTAQSDNAQVSVSGGSEKTQFLFSAGLLKQQAVLDRNYYNRLAIRSNIKHKISDKVTIGMNLGFTAVYDRTDGITGKSDVVSLGLQSDPIFPVYNENGYIGYRDPNSALYRFISYADLNLWHPYSLTRYIDEHNKTFNTLGTGFLEYAVTKNIKFRSSISANLTNNRYDSYRYKNQGYGYSSLLGSLAGLATGFSQNWLTENTLTFDKHFGNHGINILAGYTTQKQRDEASNSNATGQANDLVQTLNAGTAFTATSAASEWSLISYLARANYNYKNRYFLSAVIRRDGSSRFGENNKWGYFPSVSAGWLVSDEAFMANNKNINLLKLRVSYGLAGNNQIPNYGSIGLLGASNANYASGSTLLNGQSITTVTNPDLRWEKTTQFNVGVDLKMFNNRIGVTAEFYHSITKDMLLNVPIPDITGFSTQLTNIGKMRNMGVELNLSMRNIESRNFSWTTDFNFSLNRNKVLQLGPGNAPIIYTDYTVSVKTEVGQPLSNFYGYIFDGVFKNQAEVDAYPHDASTKPGDPKVRDVNGDKVIDTRDITTIGNNQPNFLAGLTNTVTYKGFEFSFLLQGNFGGQVVNQDIRYSGWWNNGRNMFAGVANRWKSPTDPGDGTHFRATLANTGLMSQFSTYWVESATFVRVKNIRLSYALPQRLLAKTPLKNTRLFVNAENVHLFSKYSLFDPENTTYNATSYSAGNSGLAPSGINAPSGAFIGVDYGSYPVPMTVTIGIKTDL